MIIYSEWHCIKIVFIVPILWERRAKKKRISSVSLEIVRNKLVYCWCVNQLFKQEKEIHLYLMCSMVDLNTTILIRFSASLNDFCLSSIIDGIDSFFQSNTSRLCQRLQFYSFVVYYLLNNLVFLSIHTYIKNNEKRTDSYYVQRNEINSKK